MLQLTKIETLTSQRKSQGEASASPYFNQHSCRNQHIVSSGDGTNYLLSWIVKVIGPV